MNQCEKNCSYYKHYITRTLAILHISISIWADALFTRKSVMWLISYAQNRITFCSSKYVFIDIVQLWVWGFQPTILVVLPVGEVVFECRGKRDGSHDLWVIQSSRGHLSPNDQTTLVLQGPRVVWGYTHMDGHTHTHTHTQKVRLFCSWWWKVDL